MIINFILVILPILLFVSVGFANSRMDFIYHMTKDRALYEGRAFLPIASNKDFLFFSDIRGVSNFDISTEFNLGLGGRFYLPKVNTVFGDYYFYDRRFQTNLYQQNTIGVELLANYFEARANFYAPFNIETEYTNTTIHNSTHRPSLKHTTTTPMEGKDWEFGLRFPIPSMELY